MFITQQLRKATTVQRASEKQRHAYGWSNGRECSSVLSLAEKRERRVSLCSHMVVVAVLGAVFGWGNTVFRTNEKYHLVLRTTL